MRGGHDAVDYGELRKHGGLVAWCDPREETCDALSLTQAEPRLDATSATATA